jgi:hypothetical protein
MQKINWNRVILGGLLAGLVINICEFLVDGLLLGDQWNASMKSLNRPPMGGGANAAFLLLASAAPVAIHLFPYHLMGIGLVLALVEIVAGAVIGAWLYKEPAAA